MSATSVATGIASKILQQQAKRPPHWIEGRPTVILAGWLGSEKPHLRRYERLYEKMGFQVVTRIASPSLIVNTGTQMAVNDPHKLYTNIMSSPLWSKTTTTTTTQQQHQEHSISSMQDLACATLRQIEASKCSIFLVHSFSNGGCFLWEQIRNILMISSNKTVGSFHNKENKQSTTGTEEENNRISRLKQKLVGVVFDSCPCPLSKLEEAMTYCSFGDRARFQVQKLYAGGATKFYQHQHERQAQWWSDMKHESMGVPQLYLNSKDDPIAPFDVLDELISHRQDVLGRDMIWRRTWDSSPHVRHLAKHKDEYILAVETFIEHCLHQNKKLDGAALSSRL